MIIHTPRPKSKKRKPNAKQRALAESWQAILKKYETKPVPKTAKKVEPSKPYVRETPRYPSLNSGHHDCTKKTQQQYTGTAILGIGTLHKSNAVPVFSSAEATDIARMRRG